jgi:membrane-associated phospholipid phosphatase
MGKYLLNTKFLFTYALLYNIGFTFLYSIINRTFTSNVSFEIAYDSLIPFINSEFLSIIYISLYAFAIQGMYWAFTDQKKALKGYLTLTTTAVISFLFFMMYPVCQDRSSIVPNDVLKYIWEIDTNCNLFPSLHASTATTIIIMNKNYFIKLYCVAIIATCLLLKQHTIIDISAGIILSIIVNYGVEKFLKMKKLV